MFYLFLLAHLVADFALQPLWLVRRKSRWDGLLIHVGIVLACMLALGLVEPAARALWPVMLAISGVHLLADWWKVNRADRLFAPPVVPFLLDQVIHVLTIIIALSLTLPPTLVWSVSVSAVALPAIYLSAYLVTALAVPIGLIVLLDPRFTHAGIAAPARARSFIAAVAVMTLALLGGPAALPLTLVGLAGAIGRAASPHPLDTPIGVLAIAIVSAATGALLTLLG